MSHQVARAVQPMFGAPPIPTLAEVLAKLQQRADLTPRQRADLRSAVRVLARAMGLPLEGTPARLDTLRLRLPRVLPAAHGFSRQRWNTLRSQFTAALRLAGVELLPGRFRSGLGQDWAPLYERLPGRTLRHSLSRVLHFFSVQGIAPGDVDEGAFVRFETALLETGPVDHPERIVRRTKVCWNQAGALVPGWPPHRLEVPNRRDWYSLPLAAFPAVVRGRGRGHARAPGRPRPAAGTAVPPGGGELARQASAPAAAAGQRPGPPGPRSREHHLLARSGGS